MKVICMTLFVLMSAYVHAQTCDPDDCVSYVTTTVEGNYNCSGSWMPDIEVCWGTQSSLQGDICVVMIWNNSTTETIVVDVSNGSFSYSNVSIGTGSCHAFGFAPFSGTVSLNFENASSDSCTSNFAMNCL